MSGISNLTPAVLQENILSAKTNTGDTWHQGHITRVPRALTQLTRPLTLEGKVQGSNADGSTRIQTPRGQIDIKLDIVIQRNQRVIIQIESGIPPKQAAVQSATLKIQPQLPPPLPQPATLERSDTTRQNPTYVMQNTNRQYYPLHSGQIIRLTPLPPHLQNPDGLNTMPQGQGIEAPFNTVLSTTNPGSVLPSNINISSTAYTIQTLFPLLLQDLLPVSYNQFTIVPVNKADNGVQVLFQSLLSLQQGSSNPLSFSTQQDSLAGHNAHQYLPGTQDAKIISVTRPVVMRDGTATATITDSLPSLSTVHNLRAGHILATATGHITANNNPIVKIPVFGQPQPLLFALNYPVAHLSKGTQITMQATLPADIGTNQPISPSTWFVMEDALNMLMGQLNPSQMQYFRNIFPQPASTSHQFTAAVLLFIAAARGGDIAGWIGNRADQIFRNVSSSSKGDIISRLLRDISALTGRTAATDPNAPATTQASSDWRGYTLPMLWGMDVEKIHLFVKSFSHEDESNQNKNKIKNTRFIIDLTLSRMGNVQLDGFSQPYVKRLDLVLRTEHDFAPDVRQYLRQIWHNAVTHLDMNGQLDFTRIT